MSPDPLTVHGLGADPNPYAFVGGSPIGHVDPFGLDTSGCDSQDESCTAGRLGSVGITGGAIIGAELGSTVPGIGTVVGGIVGGIIGGIVGGDIGLGISMFGSSQAPPPPDYKEDNAWRQEQARLRQNQNSHAASPSAAPDTGAKVDNTAAAVFAAVRSSLGTATVVSTLVFPPMAPGLDLMKSVVTTVDPNASLGERGMSAVSAAAIFLPGGEALEGGMAFKEGAEGVVGGAEAFTTLFHGTDIASAQSIVAQGISKAAARLLGGGDVFWATSNQEIANFFAAANPAGGEAGVVGMRMSTAALQSLIRGGAVAIDRTGAYMIQNWSAFNAAVQEFFLVMP